MAETLMSFEMTHDRVKDGRIPETIPAEALYRVLEKDLSDFQSPVFGRYFELRMYEYLTTQAELEPGSSSGSTAKLQEKRVEIGKIEKYFPNIQSEFSDFLNEYIDEYYRIIS